MRRSILSLLLSASIVVVTVLVAFGAGTGRRTAAPPPSERAAGSLEEELRAAGLHPVSGVAPIDFAVESLDGAIRSLEDYRGRIVFLNFWATWCPPCVEEMPSMQRLADLLQPEGLAMVAVNVQEERAQVERFMAEHGLSFEVLLDRSGEVGRSYAVRGLPTTVILDRSGAVMARKVGFAYWDTEEKITLFRRILERT